MMNIITGNLKPTSGMVLWNGKNAHDMGAAYRSLLGYAPQQQGLYDTFTGIRFLSYMATLKGISKKEQKGEIQRVLDYVNLTEKAYRPIGTYSGGMKQRILVAQAILGDPHLVVLDEPTANLDIATRREIMRTLNEMKHITETVLIATHDMQLVCEWAERIVVLCGGEVIADGSRNEIFGNEDVRRRAGIRPPEIFTMGQLLTPEAFCYTVEEFADCFAGLPEKGGARRQLGA